MLAAVGHSSLASLADACVPEGVRDRTPLDLPAAADEATVLAELRELSGELAELPAERLDGGPHADDELSQRRRRRAASA